MKNSNVIGIDLAKHVIQVCKIDKHGEFAVGPGKAGPLMWGVINDPQMTVVGNKRKISWA